MKKFFTLIISALFISINVHAQYPAIAYAYSTHNTATNGYDQVSNHVQDAAGNVYMTGRFIGTVDFDFASGGSPLTASSYQDLFLAKYTNTGALVWAKQIATPSSNTWGSITLDNSGNIILAGSFQDTIDFDLGPGVANLYGTTATDIDIFVAKYDNNGNYIWANMLGSPSFENVLALTTDASNNIYITGYFYTGLDMDAGAGVTTLNSMGGGNMAYFAKYDSNFGLIYAKAIGGSGTNDDADPATIKLDNLNNIFISGNFHGTVDFDPSGTVNTLTASSAYPDIFIAKYDNAGNYSTVKQIGSSGNYGDEVYKESLIIDNSNNIYIAGQQAGTVDFDLGAGSVTHSAIITDDFIVKYDAGFNFQWVSCFEGQNSQGYTAQIQIALDNTQMNVYVYGSLEGTNDFDPGPGTLIYTACCAGNNDTYLGKYSATDGSLLWCGVIGGEYIERMGSITLDAGNSIYVTGEFSRAVDFDLSPNVDSLVGASVWSYTDFYFGRYNTNSVGINQLTNGNNEVTISPNPATSGFTISLTSDKSKTVVVEVYDILGNKIIQEQHAVTTGRSLIKTSIENYSAGIYFVRLTDANSKVFYSQRLIKQ